MEKCLVFRNSVTLFDCHCDIGCTDTLLHLPSTSENNCWLRRLKTDNVSIPQLNGSGTEKMLRG